MYRLTWRLPLAGLVAFSHLQFSQIRGRQPYLIVRKILYVIIETARVHIAAWRRGGGMAARGAGAADAGDRVPQLPVARRLHGVAARIPPGPQGRRLCRGREPHGRITA